MYVLQPRLSRPLCWLYLLSVLLQHWLSDAEVSRLMQRYDLDNSGDLSADEFEKLVRKSNMVQTLQLLRF